MSRWRVPDQDGAPTRCRHTGGLPAEVTPASQCEDCVREGTGWVHLRRCLACEHVGCCDSSPQRHASRHWRDTEHPVVGSAEPNEHWAWCYPDHTLLVPGR